MKGLYQNNIKSIMNWRENNLDKYREQQLNYHHKNKDHLNQKRKKRYEWSKISKIFRDILI